jgi:sigma-70-like protein
MGAGAERSVRSMGTEPAAFTEFYRAHVHEVTRFVARRVADPQLAADLTAEVFLAAIEAAARYRGPLAARGRGCTGSRATSSGRASWPSGPGLTPVPAARRTRPGGGPGRAADRDDVEVSRIGPGRCHIVPVAGGRPQGPCAAPGARVTPGMPGTAAAAPGGRKPGPSGRAPAPEREGSRNHPKAQPGPVIAIPRPGRAGRRSRACEPGRGGGGHAWRRTGGSGWPGWQHRSRMRST